MELYVKELVKIIEAIAPPVLKEDFDNVGLMVGDNREKVSSILIALDCTLDVIEEAKNKQCNFILTHHPLLFIKPKSITNETLQGRKILSLIKNDITLYSAHTNLDSVQGGLNDYVAEALDIKNSKILDKSPKGIVEGEHGIGRIGKLENPMTLLELCNKVKDKFNLKNVRFVGDLNKEISRVAIINGSGQDYFFKAKALGAQCIITGDTSYHFVSDFKEEDICIIDAGHFGTEWSAMKSIETVLKEKLKEAGHDITIYISQSAKDPYEVL